MGYYITPRTAKHNKDKVRALKEDFGAVEVDPPDSISAIQEDKALLCAVDNGPFQAVGLVFNDRELRDFRPSARDPGDIQDFLPGARVVMLGEEEDLRPRTWLLMDKKLAHEMSGYPNGD